MKSYPRLAVFIELAKCSDFLIKSSEERRIIERDVYRALSLAQPSVRLVSHSFVTLYDFGLVGHNEDENENVHFHSLSEEVLRFLKLLPKTKKIDSICQNEKPQKDRPFQQLQIGYVVGPRKIVPDLLDYLWTPRLVAAGPATRIISYLLERLSRLLETVMNESPEVLAAFSFVFKHFFIGNVQLLEG